MTPEALAAIEDRLDALHTTHEQIIDDAYTLRDEVRRLTAARALVDVQAKDERLWFKAWYAPEEYLQAALRQLHAVIEGDA